MTDDVDTLHLKDNDPLTYSEAVNDSNSKKWREAMDSEIQSMHQNQVWYLVDPLEGIVLMENIILKHEHKDYK